MKTTTKTTRARKTATMPKARKGMTFVELPKDGLIPLQEICSVMIQKWGFKGAGFSACRNKADPPILFYTDGMGRNWKVWNLNNPYAYLDGNLGGEKKWLPFDELMGCSAGHFVRDTNSNWYFLAILV